MTQISAFRLIFITPEMAVMACFLMATVIDGVARETPTLRVGANYAKFTR